MESHTLNSHGDRLVQASAGHGSDIATQRADDLDLMAIALAASLGPDCRALDLACGLGGQAIRLARAGARVIAADLADLSAEVQGLAAGACVADRVSFQRADLRGIELHLAGQTFDIICCQRAIHYLNREEAILVSQSLSRLLNPGGRLFLSASGIDSELGAGYPGRELAVSERYAPLAEAMATKHGIDGPVCLYSLEDLAGLFLSARLVPEQLFVSPFGNVKGVAYR